MSPIGRLVGVLATSRASAAQARARIHNGQYKFSFSI